jgi:hypothetical protein
VKASTHDHVHEQVTGGAAQQALHSSLQQQHQQQQQQQQQQQLSSQHIPKQQFAAAQIGQPGTSSTPAPALGSDAGAQTAVAQAAASAAATGGQQQQGTHGAAVTAAAVFEAGARWEGFLHRGGWQGPENDVCVCVCVFGGGGAG